MGSLITFFDGGTFTGVIGMCVLLLIAYMFSTNREHVNPRIILSALFLQIGLAIFVLKVSFGQALLAGAANGVGLLISYADAGISLIFGQLSGDQFGTIFAIHVLPVIIFFSALTSVLYYLGFMQVIVRVLGRGLSVVMGTQPLESLNAAANIFLGQTEAPFVIRPYLRNISNEQLFAIMVSGMASVSGTILAAYALLGVQTEYLLAAAFMTAPGGLLMAKLMMPDNPKDVGKTTDTSFDLPDDEDRPSSVFVAAAQGAEDGVKLALSVGGMLIAFVALIALLNGMLGGFGNLFGWDDLSVQMLLGTVFAPLMSLLGIHSSEIDIAGRLVGEKLILNEFVAYISYGDIQASLSPKAQIMTTIALCGFANFSSIAIQIGTLGNLIPDKKDEIGRLGLRAVSAATLSNLMSATIAGIIFTV